MEGKKNKITGYFKVSRLQQQPQQQPQAQQQHEKQQHQPQPQSSSSSQSSPQTAPPPSPHQEEGDPYHRSPGIVEPRPSQSGISLNKQRKSKGTNFDGGTPTKARNDDSESENSDAEDLEAEDLEAEDPEAEDLETEDSEMEKPYGLKTSLHGVVFQLQLLILFAIRGMKSYNNFVLDTENLSADKFDDVIFGYESKKIKKNENNDNDQERKSDNEPDLESKNCEGLQSEFNETATDDGQGPSSEDQMRTWILLQAKHKLNPNKTRSKITKGKLMGEDKDFNLKQYLIAYYKIKAEPKYNGLKEFIFCTNSSFNDKDDMKDWFKKETTLEEDDILFFSDIEARKRRFNNEIIDSITNNILLDLVEEAVKVTEVFKVDDFTTKMLPLLKNIRKKMLLKKGKDDLSEIVRKKSEGKFPNKLVIDQTANKISKLIGKVLEEADYNKLKKAVQQLENLPKSTKGKVDPKAAKKCKKTIQEEASNLQTKFDEELGLLPDLEKVKADLDIDRKLQEDITRLENTLNLNVLEAIEDDLVKKYIPQKELTRIKNEKNREKTKTIFRTQLRKSISQISAIWIALKSEDDLKDFLKHFFYIVKYPGESRLNELITKETNKDFELLDSDLVTNSFEKNMLSWLKAPENPKLTNNDVEGFIDSISKKIKSVMTEGISLAYPEKLEEYGLEFEQTPDDVKKFLASEEEGILHIRTDVTRLSAIKLLQCLKEIKNGIKYIFIRLRTLFRKESQKLILDTFFDGNDNPKDLLVVECQTKDRDEEKECRLLDKLKEKLQNVKNSKKKIVLIAHKDDSFVKKFKDSAKPTLKNIKDKPDRNNEFQNLKVESQKVILEKRIDFQGKKKIDLNTSLTLNKIINEETGKKIIDESILSELIETEEIEIGDKKDFDLATYIPDYYLPRVLIQNSGNDAEQSEETEEDLNNTNKKLKFLILSDRSGMGKSSYIARMAKIMKDKFPNLWVVRLNLNDLTQVKAFKEIDSKFKNSIKFLLQTVIRGNHMKPMIKFQRNIFEEGLKNYSDDTDLQSNLCPGIVIFLDGYDEVSPGYVPQVKNLILYLKTSKITRLWITTRNHPKNQLEKLLQRTAYFSKPNDLKPTTYCLKPFSNLEEQSFLDKFWKWKLQYPVTKTQNQVFDTIIKYAKSLEGPKNKSNYFNGTRQEIRSLQNVGFANIVELREKIHGLNFKDSAKELLGDLKPKFIRHPLFLNILGTVIFDNKFHPIEKFGLMELFTKYEEKKIEIFFYEKAQTMPNTNQASNTLQAISSGVLKRVHQELAIKRLFSNLDLFELPNLNEEKKFKNDLARKDIKKEEELIRIGFISENQDFYHRSFAEYFVSMYMIENREEEAVQKFTKKINFKNYELLTTFLNDYFKKNPSHGSLLRQNDEIFLNLNYSKNKCTPTCPAKNP